MIRSRFNVLVLLALAVFFAACNAPGPTVTTANSNSAAPRNASGMPQPTSSVPGELTFKTPDGWTQEQPSSPMRVAQYKLPGEGSADASLVVYFFGQGQGGPVEDNFDRWVGQMQKTRDQAKTEKLTVNGLPVTLLDVSGTFTGDMMSGSTAPQPNYRMRAGVIETPKGNYFVKLVGPEKTVARWDDSFTAFVKSAEFKK
ncbi:MAG TPA: hypothetical protein VKA60_10885 [Blastocatellia bacterium]|nr:hypothetical protein [Blastocatellia bacterium]